MTARARSHRGRPRSGSRGPSSGSGRRTQAERTEATRSKLLTAATECLATLGYAHTSTTEVSRRAGVSRGAQLHHFPTKGELVAAAVDHVFDLRAAEFRVLISTLPLGPQRLDTAIEVLWVMFQGPTLQAWYELVIASRTDPELQPHVARVADSMSRRVQEAWSELFPPPPGYAYEPLFAEVAPTFLFSVLDGLALQQMTGASRADDDARKVLTALRYLATENIRLEPTTPSDQPRPPSDPEES